jgi:hypothetical protein
MAHTSGSGMASLIVLAVSLLWLGAVAHFAWQGWPSVPLDMSPTDPATRTAYDNAVTAHLIRYGLAGLVPVLIVYAVARLFRRRS